MQNRIGGAGQRIPTLTVQETWDRLQTPTDAEEAPVLIDVRETWEFQQGHARGARNIPLSEFNNQLSTIPADRDVFFICQSGSRSAAVTKAMIQAGYSRVFNVHGGTTVWMMHQLPLG